MDKQTDWALHDIAVERRRQIERGYGPAHDAQHVHGEIAVAAGLIACDATDTADGFELASPGESWMDDLAAKVAAKYGDDRRRRLVIAGAMIVAEIERLDRAERLSGD